MQTATKPSCGIFFYLPFVLFTVVATVADEIEREMNEWKKAPNHRNGEGEGERGGGGEKIAFPIS